MRFKRIVTDKLLKTINDLVVAITKILKKVNYRNEFGVTFPLRQKTLKTNFVIKTGTLKHVRNPFPGHY